MSALKLGLGIGMGFGMVFAAVGLLPGTGGTGTPANAPVAAREVDARQYPGIHETIVEFPSRSTQKQTAWKIWWSVPREGNGKENFRIDGAWFRPDMNKNWIRIISDTQPAEVFSAYTDGTRFYDIKGFAFKLDRMSARDAGSPTTGAVLGNEAKVVGELRDRGILWKRGADVVRGEELVLWACFKAANYDYIFHYAFQDDGVIILKMGFTGINHGHQPGPEVAHMHNALWRIDIDLGGTSPNNVYTVRHKEPWGETGLSKDFVEPFNGGYEGFADWDPREFTHLRIENPSVKNKRNNPISYDLIPIVLGTGRHYNHDQSPNQQKAGNQMKAAGVKEEHFSLHDFWVTPYAKGETDFTQLPNYVRQGRKLAQQRRDANGNPVEDADVVLWHMSSLYHIPRDEDFVGARAGVALATYCACMLRPRNLFDQTPFYFPTKGTQDDSRPINR